MSSTENIFAKSVLITGANRGIGLELVKQLLSSFQPRPSHVFATYRSSSETKELKVIASQNPALHIIPISDIRDFSSYDSIVKQVESIVGNNGLNLLINNAGIAFKNQGLDAVNQQQMMETFEINAVSPLLLTKAFLPLLKNAASSSSHPMSCARSAVINVTSIIGSIENNKIGRFYSYGPSKAALNMITKSLSIDLKPENILVAAIHPGWVQTDMGGPNATMIQEDSGRMILHTLRSLREGNTGQFLNYDGKILPW